ncbi:MAG TPA: AraC family transcriptional regulator [Ignavibacteria bacterium]|jgi:AraC-like DNA-binding protein
MQDNKKQKIFIPEYVTLYQRLYRSKEFIDDCYNEPIDLNAIAREAFFSPYHFLRLFKKVYNRTPHQYLTERRIDKAKELLKKNETSVTEVCFDVGFESLGSFSSLFTRNVGISPVEFKRQYERRIFLSVHFPEKLIPGCWIWYIKG